MATSFAREIAAKAWCGEKTSHKKMDHDLAEEFAEILDKYIEALCWCSGSPDFSPEGSARAGWQKVVRPLIGIV